MINSFCFQSKEINSNQRKYFSTGKNIKSYRSNKGENHRNPEWFCKFKYK